MKKRQFWQRYRNDIVAMLVYNLIAGGLTLIYEVLLAGASTEQWLGVRIIYTIIRFSGAFMLGYLIDWFRQLLSKRKYLLAKAIADFLALSVYQLPIYCLSAILMGVPIASILISSSLYVADNLLLGWLYGYILDRVRKYYSTAKAII